jgi:hypothetical protein
MNSGSPAFIGIKISDTGNQLPDFVSASVTNTAYTPSTYGNSIEGFTPSQVIVDANNIYINLNTSRQRLTWHAGSRFPVNRHFARSCGAGSAYSFLHGVRLTERRGCRATGPA